MIKHIVLFKLTESVPVESFNEKLADIKIGLESLISKIDTLRSIEVGINCNPKESYQLALTCVFDDMAGLEFYASHPDHVAVGAKIREVLEMRACVDYSF